MQNRCFFYYTKLKIAYWANPSTFLILSSLTLPRFFQFLHFNFIRLFHILIS